MTNAEERLIAFYRSPEACEWIDRYGLKGAERRIVEAAIRTARRPVPEMARIEKAEALIRSKIAESRREVKPLSEEELRRLEESWEAVRHRYAEGKRLKRSVRRRSVSLLLLAAVAAFWYLALRLDRGK